MKAKLILMNAWIDEQVDFIIVSDYCICWTKGIGWCKDAFDQRYNRWLDLVVCIYIDE